MGKSLFKQMGATYHREGNYLLPDIELPKEKPIGVWGCGSPVAPLPQAEAPTEPAGETTALSPSEKNKPCPFQLVDDQR